MFYYIVHPDHIKNYIDVVDPDDPNVIILIIRIILTIPHQNLILSQQMILIL